MAGTDGGIIAISGYVGSGKNTLGAVLARRLGWRQVEPTFKTLAAREGIPLMEFQARAKRDPDIDKKFDAALKAECAGGNCVVTTWLGPWMAPGSPFKVWLDAADELRAERISRRDGLGPQEALAHLRKRDADNRARYLSVYGIDIADHRGFDVVLTSRGQTPEQLADEVLAAYDAKRKRE